MEYKTYVWVEKNGNATLIFSVDCTGDDVDREAEEMLKEKVKYPDGWRLDHTEKEDE